MENQKRICRLCFKTCDNYNAIDDDIKDLLDVMLPKIDIAAIQEPVICTNCIEMLFKCFDFKTKCFYTHDELVPFVNNENDVKLNLKDIYRSKNGNSVLEDQSICALCMSPVKNCSAVVLFAENRNTVLEEMLERCLPELNFCIIKEPVICATCHLSLEKYFQFVTNFVIVEDKIKKYKDNLNINNTNEIELSRLLQFIGRGADGDIIELEQPFCDHWESINKEVEDKHNSSVDIDDLIFDDEQEFTPKNILGHEIACNEIDKIKTEETFCGKNRIDPKKELFLKVENLKCLCDEEIEIKTIEVIEGVASEVNYNGGDVIELEQLSCDKHDSSGNSNDLLLDNTLEVKPKNTLSCEMDTSLINGSFRGENRIVLRELFVKLVNLQLSLEIETDELAIGDVVSEIDGNGGDEIVLERSSDLSESVEVRRNSSIDVNDSEFETERDFPSKNLLAPEIESNTNKRGTYCRENRIALKELIVNVENLNIWFDEVVELETDNPDFNRLEVVVVTTKPRVIKCSIPNLEEQLSKPPLKKESSMKKKVTVNMTYQCECCSFQTKNRNNLDKHLLKHKYSELTMNSKNNFEKQLLVRTNSSEVTMYKCASCTFQTIYKPNIKEHVLRHRDPLEVATYKCESCTFQTIYRSSFRRHSRMHKDPSEATMYKCNSCTFQTIYKLSLKKHFLTHKDPSEVTIFKCDYCEYQTMYDWSFKMHLLKHKGPLEVATYKCESCTYQTIYKYKLRWHSKEHEYSSDVTMYKCDFCTYQTIYKYCLKKHMSKHKDPEVTIFKCDSCTFQTIYKLNLKDHLLRHRDPLEVATYKCESCTFLTIYKASFRRHSKIHKDPSEVTMYKCDSCTFQTIYKRSLKTHLMKHKDPLEVATYKCDSCTFQSIYKGSFQKHSRIHKDPSEVTMYKCDSCTFQTIHKKNLKKHFLKHKDPSEVTKYSQ